MDSAARAFSQQISEISDVEFQIFPQRSLYDDMEGFFALQTGSLDGWIGDFPATKIDGSLKVFDVPFLIRDHEHLARVYHAMIDTGAAGAALENADLKLVAPLATGTHGIASRDPIYDASSMEGLKIGVIGDEITSRAFREIGASTLRIPFSELYPASAAGAIDAVAGPIRSFTSLGLHEAFTSVTLTNHVFGTTFLLVGAETASRIGDGLVEVGHSVSQLSLETTRQTDFETIEKLESSGVDVVRASADGFEYLGKITFDLFLSEVPEGWDTLTMVQDLG